MIYQGFSFVSNILNFGTEGKIYYLFAVGAYMV